MDSYYDQRLAAKQLKRCYQIAPPAVRRYLRAEIDHVGGRIRKGHSILDLGCGYGRVLKDLTPYEPSFLMGIDISHASLLMARDYLRGINNVTLAQMDALHPALTPGLFDIICCVQNGISAFHVDQRTLMRVAVGLAKPGGIVLFSSYAEEFWEDRLLWFRMQAAHGLIGEIDETRSGNGIILCRDGFTATTVSCDEFVTLAAGLGKSISVQTIDGSSVFCEIRV